MFQINLKVFLDFKIEDITFKGNDFKIESRVIAILLFHYTSKREEGRKLRLKYNSSNDLFI